MPEHQKNPELVVYKTQILRKKPAVFLDRDGVIIENRSDYVRSWSDVALIPGSIDALVRLNESSFDIVVVTNQSVIGRGLISLQEGRAINDRLVQLIEDRGGRVDAVLMCPHTPHAGCDCRKPLPGLLQQAAKALDLDLSRSIMIGDALTDLAAGQAAGVAQRIILQTGRGRDQLSLPEAKSMYPFEIYEDLIGAVSHILRPD